MEPSTTNEINQAQSELEEAQAKHLAVLALAEELEEHVEDAWAKLDSLLI